MSSCLIGFFSVSGEMCAGTSSGEGCSGGEFSVLIFRDPPAL